MDLRGLDPFVAHPPGRAGNLYETFDWSRPMNGIQESPMELYEQPSKTQCKTVTTAGTLCFQQHVPRDDVIPPRRIEFDPNIEDLRETTEPQTSVRIATMKKTKKGMNPMIPLFILLAILYFAEW